MIKCWSCSGLPSGSRTFFEGFLPWPHHGADTDVMRGCNGFYTYVALLVCGASAVSHTPELLGGGLCSPSAFLFIYLYVLFASTWIEFNSKKLTFTDGEAQLHKHGLNQMTSISCRYNHSPFCSDANKQGAPYILKSCSDVLKLYEM